MITYASIVADILDREGSSFTNIPGDKGGPTKYGITQEALSDYLNRKALVSEVQSLNEQLATKIYMQLYIVRPGFDRFNNMALTEQLVDAGVQHGPTMAVKLLQRSLGMQETGEIVLTTIQAVAKLKPLMVTLNFMAARAHYYADCLQPESNWQFGGGWFNRFGGLLTKLSQAQNLNPIPVVAKSPPSS